MVGDKKREVEDEAGVKEASLPFDKLRPSWSYLNRTEWSKRGKKLPMRQKSIG